MLTNQNPTTSFEEWVFSALKIFRQSRHTLNRHFWQDATAEAGLSRYSVCRTGAGKRMKIGAREMVSQEMRRWLLDCLL